jgi:hypothetical protein
MPDNARIGVVRAMIAPAESNPKKQPPILEKAVKTIPWIHQDVNCKNLQEIPLSATEVQCNKCNKNVEITSTKPSLIKNNKDDWGALKPQSAKKKTNFTQMFSSEIVKVGKTLTKHISGSRKLKAVVYVSNPIEILNFLDEHDVEEMELVMGHQRVHDFRSELTPDIVERLIGHRNSGRLRLFVSPTVHFHSKIYICEFEKSVKMINGSANLTKTGMGIKGTQWNHIWIMELKGDYSQSEDFQTEIELYETYRNKTSEFFGEFGDAFEQIEPENKIEVIENWIASGDVYGLPEDAQIRKVTRLIVDEVMSPDLEAQQTVVSIIPNASEKAVKQVTNAYASFGVTIESEGHITVPIAKYLDHKTRQFPMMVVNMEKEAVYLGWNGKSISRTCPKFEPETINDSLMQIEKFIESVDLAEPEFPLLAKTSVSEAILYILSSPFHHEYMKKRRDIFGITEERGPRILHLYGDTSNGKSKLLTYCSLLLTGKEIITPLEGDIFSDSKVVGLRSWQSVFPMMWDDLTNDKWGATAEKVIKTHWDKRWTKEEYCPQLILTSNRQCPRGPLQTRVKEIHLSATYPRTTESRVELAKHLQSKNRLFEFFSKAYFQKAKKLQYNDDESHIGRAAFKQLYSIAGRKIPKWMPLDRPLDETYNATSVRLLKAIVDKSCTVSKNADEIILEFDENIQHWELKPYVDGIPNEFEWRKQGNRYFVRRPDKFKPWIRDAYPWIGKRKLSWRVKRLFR